jgi:hypothetical protein
LFCCLNKPLSVVSINLSKYFSRLSIMASRSTLPFSAVPRLLLEREGLLLRDVQGEGGRPANKYLGIDPDDPRIEVTIYDDDGWLSASIAWTEEGGRSIAITGIELGEMGDLIAQLGNELKVSQMGRCIGRQRQGKV